MNKYLLWIMLFLGGIMETGQAQILPVVEGTVEDKSGRPLEAATVVLLSLPDSVVAVYSLTDDKGTYHLRCKLGTYALQVNYIGHQPYSRKLSIQGDTSFPFIVLETVSDMLTTVEVTAEHLPVQMRGDTLSFNSAAFKVRSHDDAAALLRQLPGLSIQEDGTILFNGQKVTEVLVDGKVFFGDDAQATLRTLSADAIKKIDITDTKIDSKGREVENEEKTINLRLKNKAKTGTSGHINGGYGHTVPPANIPPTLENFGDHRYRLDASLTYFTPTVRSAIQAGSGNVALSNPVPMGIPLPVGIRRKNNLGATFNWVPSRNTTWNNNYKYTQSRTTVQQETRELSILPEQDFERLKTQTRINTPASHRISSNFKHSFDKQHLLRLRLTATYRDSRNESQRLEYSLDQGLLQSSLYQNYENRQFGYSFMPNIGFEKRFDKKGRQLITNIGSKLGDDVSRSINNAWTDLYDDNGQYKATDNLAQEQERNNGQQNYAGSVVWKEPFGKKSKLYLTIKGGLECDQTKQVSYDVKAVPSLINTDLSSSFQRYYNYQSGIASWRYRDKVHHLEVTGGVRRSLLHGFSDKGKIRQELYLPTSQIKWHYTFKKGKKLLLNYNLYLIEMTLSQLQPFVNNDDPLALYQGNPNLRPSVNHCLTMHLDWFEQRDFSNFYFYLSGLLTPNTILQQQQVDDDLRFIYQPVNAGLSHNLGFSLGYNRFFQVLDFVLDVALSGIRRQQPFLLNDKEDQQCNYGYRFIFKGGNKKKKIIDWGVKVALDGGMLLYPNSNRASTEYLNQYYGGYFRLDFLKHWEAQTMFGLNCYSRSMSNEDPTIVLWSFSIKRRFLESECLEIELSAENLFNETLRWQRSQQAFSLTEQRTQNLGRYIMLSLRYKFRKSGG